MPPHNPDATGVPPPELPSEVLTQPDKAPTPAAAPVAVRSVALIVLALLAGIFMLSWAQAVLVPLLLGLTFSYALTPLVNRVERRATRSRFGVSNSSDP